MGVGGEATGFFGSRLGAHLGMDSSHLLNLVRPEMAGLSMTRLSCDRDRRERTAPTPLENAFSLLHQLRDLDGHACWQAGRQRFAGAFRAGTVSVVDLREQAACEFRGSFEAVQFYIPKRSLDDLVYEQSGRSFDTLKGDRALPDPILTSLCQLLQSALSAEDPNHLLIDHLSLSLLAHVAGAYGGVQALGTVTGGLAPWQQRRAKDILHERLGDRLTMEEVARECRLTPSYFARAFRRSMGLAPHQYLTRVRLERAKDLMRTTEMSLADVALACGFGDQSYFTRTFTRHVGTSPGQWRRNSV